jgi:hypothetical protein
MMAVGISIGYRNYLVYSVDTGIGFASIITGHSLSSYPYLLRGIIAKWYLTPFAGIYSGKEYGDGSRAAETTNAIFGGLALINSKKDFILSMGFQYADGNYGGSIPMLKVSTKLKEW